MLLEQDEAAPEKINGRIAKKTKYKMMTMTMTCKMVHQSQLQQVFSGTEQGGGQGLGGQGGGTGQAPFSDWLALGEVL